MAVKGHSLKFYGSGTAERTLQLLCFVLSAMGIAEMSTAWASKPDVALSPGGKVTVTRVLGDSKY